MCTTQTMEVFLNQYGPTNRDELDQLLSIIDHEGKNGRFNVIKEGTKVIITDFRHGASITLGSRENRKMFRLLASSSYH